MCTLVVFWLIFMIGFPIIISLYAGRVEVAISEFHLHDGRNQEQARLAFYDSLVRSRFGRDLIYSRVSQQRRRILPESEFRETTLISSLFDLTVLKLNEVFFIIVA